MAEGMKILIKITVEMKIEKPPVTDGLDEDDGDEDDDDGDDDDNDDSHS